MRLWGQVVLGLVGGDLVTAETQDERRQYVVICVDDDPEVLASLVASVEGVCNGLLDVQACEGPDEVLRLLRAYGDQGVRVPLIITEHAMQVMLGADLLIAINELAAYRESRKVLLSGQVSIEEVGKTLSRFALDGVLPNPWTTEEVRYCVRELLTDYFIKESPDELDRFSSLLTVGRLSRALTSSEHDRRELDSTLKALQRSFLGDIEMSDEDVEEAMIRGVDEALGYPERQHLPAGSVILREGEQVQSISIVVSGEVQLSRRSGSTDIIFHSHTSGRVIGLLALARRGGAFFTCKAITDVEVIVLTVEELADALQKNAWLSVHFVTVLIRSLATRNRRVADLRVKVDTLASDVAAERDQLAEALDHLEKTQALLVESEKMATLGQLSAGVAHELNNPIAAIQRAVDFLAEDMMSLVAVLPEGEICKAAMHSALTRAPVSTRELRERERALAAAVGDKALAKKLVKIGVDSISEYQSQLGRLSARKRDRRLADMERYYELGTSLRNICSCSDHVADIVKGLRSYARTDQDPISNVDVHEGLEDTLRLLGHQLRDVEIKRHFGELPGIQCHISQLNQVWTNLISNALEAMGGKGTLRIETEAVGTDQVAIRIIDDGPGIPPDVLEKIFELHFTTKDGRVRFGLGMGLSICRQIVGRHEGTMSVESKPGETCFTVVLPVQYARSSQDETSGEAQS